VSKISPPYAPQSSLETKPGIGEVAVEGLLERGEKVVGTPRYTNPFSPYIVLTARSASFTDVKRVIIKE
jgi:hypothetical protein